MDIKVRKGLDIKLQGGVERGEIKDLQSDVYAVKPGDFHGVVPKLELKAGAEVLAGTAIFHDKYHEAVKFVSPVSGEIAEVVRGEKRRILEIRIIPDQEIRYESFGQKDINTMSDDDVRNHLMASGLWASIKQRPYDVIASADSKPKEIFVSAHDSGPLPVDLPYIISQEKANFGLGLKVLSKMTEGKVHVGVPANANMSEFGDLSGVETHYLSGPHPVGNASVMIQKVSPINKGDTVWTVGAQDVIMIGRLFSEGKYDARKVVALTGSLLSSPGYARVIDGISVKGLLNGKQVGEGARYISGNVLTGETINAEGFFGRYHQQLTLIPEVPDREFFGWIAPGFNKFSVSRTFFSWLSPNKQYDLNTSQNGEERAFVMTGQYEKVFPFDVYPVQLLKSIMVEDIELMENLGIYEVAPEDFALCEYVCTSKINSQQVVRDGLDLMVKEMS